MRAEIERLREEIDNLPTHEDVDKIAKVVVEKEEKITSLTSKLAQAESQPRIVEKVPVEVEQLLLQRETRIAELLTEVKTLKDSMNAASKVQADKAALEHKIKDMHADNELTIIELGKREATVAKVQAELATALEEIAKLKEQVESLKEDLKTSRDDENFFRSHYDQASRIAVEEAQKNDKLNEDNARLKSQLDIGLKQRALHSDTINKKREAEHAKLRMQTKVLLDQARLTDDAVRKKAALYDRYRRENEQYKLNEVKWEERYDALQARNEELAEQNTILRGRQMGAFGDDDDYSEYSEGDAEDDMTDGETSPMPLSSRTRTSRARTTAKVRPMARRVDESLGFSASQIMPGESQFVGESNSNQIESLGADQSTTSAKPEQVDGAGISLETGVVVDGGVGFLCKWNEGPEACTLMFDSQSVSLLEA